MNEHTQSAESETQGRRPDPGNRRAAAVAWVLGLVLLAVLVVTNMRSAREDAAAKLAEMAKEPEPPTVSDPFLLSSKMLLRLVHGSLADPASSQMIETNLVAAAQTDLDRLRLAMLRADMAGDEEGLKSLEGARERAAAGKGAPAWWDEDAASLERVLTNGETGSSESLDALKARHGWFAEVLATRRLSMTDPARRGVIGGEGALIFMALAAGGVILVAVVGGLVAGVFALIGLFGGKFRSGLDVPLPGGSVYLETLAVFLIGFLGLKQVMPLVLAMTGVLKEGVEPPAWLTPFSLGTQWLLLPLIFWPLVRGVSWGRWRRDMGWHSGRGVWREIWSGVYAYFAGLPLLAMAAIVTLVIVLIRQAAAAQATGEPAPPPSNPIVEILGSASGFTMLMLFVLATVWAPVVEETLFRGGLFRHLRSRLGGMFGVLLAAGLSAVWFGLMHSYEIPLLLPVITLGFVFALMREWRGSLIGCMVAHGLHNATVLGLAIGFLRAIS